MKKIIVVLVFFWFLFSVNYATSPKLPLFEYNYFGYLTCDTFISKENYTLRLYGKNGYYENYQALYGLQIDNETSIYITDTTGNFFLTVNSHELYDSLKVGIVIPKKEIFFSRAYSINENQYYEKEVHYTPESESGCSCTTEPTQTRIEKYQYTQSDIILNICGI